MRQAKKMNVVLGVKSGDGGSEKHGLIVRMCKDKENMVLFVDSHSFFIDENNNKGE